VYVGQFSFIRYFYLQKKVKADETLKGKHAFEEYAVSCVRVEIYHEENGIFKAG
jgi:hypothetical protein